MSGLSKSTATGFRDGNVNLNHVHVGKRRTCRLCHRAHAGPNDRLVRETVGYGRAGYELKIGFENRLRLLGRLVCHFLKSRR